MVTASAGTIIAWPREGIARGALTQLMMAAIFSFLDRQILTLLVQPIKADLRLSDTQIGVLQGFAFAGLFSCMAMPIGWLVDRVRRWRVAAVGIALWSLATIGCGLARSYEQLLIARMMIGVGEASLMPAAYSLLCDYYPPERRGRAFGTFSLAIFAGGGGSLLIGGGVLHALGEGHVALGPLGVRPVWQAAFLLVGAPGLVLAAGLAAMRDPTRRGQAPRGEDDRGFGRFLAAHGRPFALVWTAYVLVSFVAYAVLPWAPVQLGRHFALGSAQTGVACGVLQLIGGGAGSIVAGVLADRWTAQGRLGGKFRLTLVMWIGGFPALALFSLAGSLPLALLGYALFGFFNTVGYVSASAVVQDMVPGHLRGRATGFWYFVTGILGNGAGPFATALIADRVLHSEALLGPAILIAAGPAMLLGIIVSVAGLRPYDQLRRAVSSRGDQPIE